MPTGAGFASALAYGLESTWSTAVAVTDALNWNSDSMNQLRAKVPKMANRGRGARNANKNGHIIAGGGVNLDLTYDLEQPWLTHFFGTHNTDTTDYYSLDDQITDGLTLAFDRGVSVHEYEGYVIDQATLTGTPDAGVVVDWNGAAKQRLISGTTNNAAAIAGAAAPGNCVLWHHCTLRVGDTADALASGDNLEVTQFTLDLNRNKLAKVVNSQYRARSRENGHRDFTLSFTLGFYESNQFLTWEAADTALQAALIFTDGTNTQEWRMSHLKVESVETQQGGDELTEVPVVLRLFENESAVNTQTGYDFDPELQLYES